MSRPDPGSRVDEAARRISDLLDGYPELRAVVAVINPVHDAPCAMVTVGYDYPEGAADAVRDLMQAVGAIAEQSGGQVSVYPFPVS